MINRGDIQGGIVAILNKFRELDIHPETFKEIMTKTGLCSSGSIYCSGFEYKKI